MSVVVRHPNQTSRQPVVWMCRNPLCLEPPRKDFCFESDYPRCPKCAAEGEPYIQKRVLMHLLVPDPQGLIPGQFGKFRMACDATRSHLATRLNGEGATDNPRLINCPGCLRVWKNDPQAILGSALTTKTFEGSQS